MARPKKDVHSVRINISCYPEDIKFINEHCGKATTSAYLIESAYQHAGEFSRIEKLINENKELKKQNEELEKKLMFANTTIERLSKKKQCKTEINEAELLRFYNEKKLENDIAKFGNQINWEKVFDRNIEKLAGSVGDYRELQTWCMNRYMQR